MGVIAVFFYPEIEALVFGEPPVATRPLPPLPRATPEPPKPAEPVATLLRDAKLRIGDAGPMGRILVAGEPGNDILPQVAPLAGEIVIDKPGKGAFYATALGDILRLKGITHLLFAGVTTEVCVQTSMREATDRGYECLVVEDATESYFPEFKRAALDMIRAQGAIVGWSATCDEVATALNGVHR